MLSKWLKIICLGWCFSRLTNNSLKVFQKIVLRVSISRPSYLLATTGKSSKNHHSTLICLLLFLEESTPPKRVALKKLVIGKL